MNIRVSGSCLHYCFRYWLKILSVQLLYLLLYFPSIGGDISGKRSIHETKIFRGSDTQISEIPYQAALEDVLDDEAFCGACLISDTWLVTAAHCFTTINHFTEMTRIRVGSASQGSGGSTYVIERIVMHPDFDNKTLVNDICLIELLSSIAPDKNKQPIGIVGPNDTFQSGTLMKISGWGATEINGHTSPSLKSATVRVISNFMCAKAYKMKALYPNTFCLTATTSSVCPGDSGGPAVIDKKLAGIIMASYKCTTSFYPIILTNISNFFFWIENLTGLML